MDFSTCIDTDFDPFNAISKNKILGKAPQNGNADCEVNKKKGGKNELSISKGSRDYYSKKMKEYYDKNLEYVDIVEEQHDTPKKIKGGVKLIKKSKHFARHSKKAKNVLDMNKVKKSKRKYKTMTQYVQAKNKKKNGFDESNVDFSSFCIGMNDLFKSQ